MLYSKDFALNVKQRAEILMKARESDEFRAHFMQACANDILLFFNLVLWTYNPRLEEKIIPFITYDFQDDWILWIEKLIKENKDGITEKSRDMGVSWMMIGILYHHWIFGNGFNTLIGSYIEDLIDSKENMDTHFERLRFLIRNTPSWMLPKYTDTYMNLTNQEKQNSILGYAPTAKFSRQGRYSLIWADEFAFWQWGRSAWKAMADATRCRLASSTPDGKGNKFAELALKTKIEKKTLHWALHPLKTRKWYEEECARRTVEEVAQELDISYNKSVVGRVYPEFCERNYITFEEYDATQPLYVVWDFGLKDPTAMLWVQVDPRDLTVRIVDAYQNKNLAIDFYVPFVTGIVKSVPGVPGYKYENHELNMIAKHKTWQAAVHFGDPTGRNNDRGTQTSFFKELKKEGIIINSNTKEFDLKTRIHKTKLLIRRLVVNKDLVEFIDAMENARYPDRGEDSQATTPIDKPIHDWTSHFRTALEYFAVNEPQKTSRSPKNTVLGDPDDVEKRLEQMLRKKGRKSSNPSYSTAC